TACLRLLGKATERHVQNYHRLLNRDHGSALATSRSLLTLRVAAFAPSGPLIFGLDDTIERRGGERLGQQATLSTSVMTVECRKNITRTFDRLIEAVCYAA